MIEHVNIIAPFWQPKKIKVRPLAELAFHAINSHTACLLSFMWNVLVKASTAVPRPEKLEGIATPLLVPS